MMISSEILHNPLLLYFFTALAFFQLVELTTREDYMLAGLFIVVCIFISFFSKNFVVIFFIGLVCLHLLMTFTKVNEGFKKGKFNLMKKIRNLFRRRKIDLSNHYKKLQDERKKLKNLVKRKINPNIIIKKVPNPAIGMVAESRANAYLENKFKHMNRTRLDIKRKLNNTYRNAKRTMDKMLMSLPVLQNTACYSNKAGSIPCSDYVRLYSNKIVNDYHNSLANGKNNLLTKKIIGGTC